MLKSHAEADLADAINAYARGRYDSTAEREALAALIADEACILTTGGCSNQAAARIAGAVNRGDARLFILCEAFGRTRSFGTPEGNIRSYILESLVGVNDAGRDMLADAWARFGRKSEAA